MVQGWRGWTPTVDRAVDGERPRHVDAIERHEDLDTAQCHLLSNGRACTGAFRDSRPCQAVPCSYFQN
jgi:hypothetical protein